MPGDTRTAMSGDQPPRTPIMYIVDELHIFKGLFLKLFQRIYIRTIPTTTLRARNVKRRI